MPFYISRKEHVIVKLITAYMKVRAIPHFINNFSQVPQKYFT